MPWDALANRILTEGNRKKELEVEKQSEYAQWVSEIYSEIEVFVKRVNNLGLSNSEDRDQFYDFAERLSDRLSELRDRSESSTAPAEVLIQLEELIEKVDENSSQAVVSVAYLGNDPVKKARHEKKMKKRERERAEKAREQRDLIADEIQELNDVFEEASS